MVERCTADAGWAGGVSPRGSLAAAPHHLCTQTWSQKSHRSGYWTDKATDTLAIAVGSCGSRWGAPCKAMQGPARGTRDPFYRVNARDVIGRRAPGQGLLPRFWSWDAGAAPAPWADGLFRHLGRPAAESLSGSPRRARRDKDGERGTLWT